MNEKSIELLNRAVRDELAAVHQYMYFHFHLDDQAFDLLSTLFKRTAIQEMGHVEILAERILFLKGEVTMQVAEDVKLVRDVDQILEMARKMEETVLGITTYGRMNALPMLMLFRRRFLNSLWLKKSSL